MSLAALDAEELSGSVNGPTPLLLSELSDIRPGMDAVLFCILSKAVEELGLKWFSLEDPTRSRLDEWFLTGYCRAPRQRASLFFLEVHDKLTRSWRASYSACLHASTSSFLTSVRWH